MGLIRKIIVIVILVALVAFVGIGYIAGGQIKAALTSQDARGAYAIPVLGMISAECSAPPSSQCAEMQADVDQIASQNDSASVKSFIDKYAQTQAMRNDCDAYVDALDYAFSSASNANNLLLALDGAIGSAQGKAMNQPQSMEFTGVKSKFLDALAKDNACNADVGQYAKAAK